VPSGVEHSPGGYPSRRTRALRSDENTFRQVAAGEITAAQIQDVGHLVAQEAPEQLAAVILEFTGRVDAEQLTSEATDR
jgi:hypothetical protein